jgi:hypothetical protein
VAEGDLGEELAFLLELLQAHGQLVGGLPSQSQYGSGCVWRDGEDEHGYQAGFSERVPVL